MTSEDKKTEVYKTMRMERAYKRWGDKKKEKKGKGKKGKKGKKKKSKK